MVRVMVRMKKRWVGDTGGTTAPLLTAAALLSAVAACLAGCQRHSGSVAGDAAAATTNPESSTRLIAFQGKQGVELDPDSFKLAGITTTTVGMESLRSTVQPTGQISATDNNTVLVTSRLPGRIVSVNVSVGSLIRKGDVLASIDSVDLTQAEAAYQTARSHMVLTLDQLHQQKKLAGYGALSEQPVEDARRAYAAARAAVASDQAQIAVDQNALQNTTKLVQMGEITHKPVEDAQNAYAQAQAARIQAEVNLHSAKANLDRTQSLFNSGVYSKQQLEDAETANNNAVASLDETRTQEKLAKGELDRQDSIYQQNLNGSASLQQAQSKLTQDQHTYENDLTALELNRKELARAQVVRTSGISINQAVQQAQDAYDESVVTLQGAAETLKLYGVTPGQGMAQLANGHAMISVMAPMDGIVVSRSMVVGQMTDTSTPLAKIDNLGEVYVDAQVYEKDLQHVAAGDPIQVRVAAFPGRVFTGRVANVGTEVSPDTRTLTVRTVISNPGWLLRPGMFATVVIGSSTGIHSLAVPPAALLQEGTSQAVYVEVAPRQFVKRTVRTGSEVNGEAPVLEGLQPGDKVVVNGNELLESEQTQLEQSSAKGSAA